MQALTSSYNNYPPSTNCFLVHTGGRKVQIATNSSSLCYVYNTYSRQKQTTTKEATNSSSLDYKLIIITLLVFFNSSLPIIVVLLNLDRCVCCVCTTTYHPLAEKEEALDRAGRRLMEYKLAVQSLLSLRLAGPAAAAAAVVRT